MLKGWIAVRSEKEKSFLGELGIEMGKYNREYLQFDDCIVSLTALRKLERFWGRFYWDLEKE